MSERIDARYGIHRRRLDGGDGRALARNAGLREMAAAGRNRNLATVGLLGAGEPGGLGERLQPSRFCSTARAAFSL